MSKTRKIAYIGIMSGVIMVLSAVEHALPPLPLLPPGVKLGLSNIITMYCVFFLGNKEASGLAALKSCFAMFTRGPVAGLLSFCGGMLSIITVMLLVFIFKSGLSYIAAAISGAVAHNIGQIIAVSFLMKTSLIFYYFPVLIISGILLGAVTGTMLKITLPLFQTAFNSIARQNKYLPDEDSGRK